MESVPKTTMENSVCPHCGEELIDVRLRGFSIVCSHCDKVVEEVEL